MVDAQYYQDVKLFRYARRLASCNSLYKSGVSPGAQNQTEAIVSVYNSATAWSICLETSFCLLYGTATLRLNRNDKSIAGSPFDT